MKISKSKSYNHISLNDIKQHLRINQDYLDDDTYLNQLIKVSTQIAENYIGDDIALTTTTIQDYDFAGSDYVIHSPSILTISGITGNTTTITGYTTHYFFNYTLIEFEYVSSSR